MAGPAKKRAQAEKKPTGSSEEHQSTQNSSGREVTTQRSSPKSIPRLDGNRDPQVARKGAPVEYTLLKDLRNLSEFLGMGGWACARGYELPPSLPPRPAKFNSLGKEITVTLNTFNVLAMPQKVVHQYDVTVGSGTEKRGLIKKIWESKAVQNELGAGNFWLYDGNKLAWSMKDINRHEIRIEVDLDKEENRPIKPGRENKNVHRIFIRKTKQVDFAGLYNFLQGKASWSNDCIDTINFMDHVMREFPSQNYTQIKKSFFQRGERRFDLGQGIEAFKGVFSSLRPVLTEKGEKGLTVNVDVANGTFWRSQPLTSALMQTFNANGAADIQNKFNQAKQDWDKSFFKKDLNRFRKLQVVDTHRPDKVTTWTIDKFIHKDVMEVKFKEDQRDSNGNITSTREVTLADYFRNHYGRQVARNIPVVQMTKRINGGHVYLPVDVLKIEPNQRYNSKLSDQQTSQMIKFAVTLPKQRWEAVESGKGLLNWDADPYLKHYGVRISTTPAQVKARILPSPEVHFGSNKKVDAKMAQTGRWRIDQQKFLLPNRTVLDAWGVCVVEGRQPNVKAKADAENFINQFVRIYEGHGGRFTPAGKKPHLTAVNLSRGGELVTDVWNQTGNKFNKRPQFLVFIVSDRNAENYRRIKKSCDCRYGVVSQVLQARQVQTASAQYISNVCLKVNCKLGGTNSQAKGNVLARIAPKLAATPTMVVGADVSHPPPGAGSLESASFAAITMSADRLFARYLAQCDTNGHRVEMVTTHNIKKHLGQMAKYWISNVGGGAAPQRILYVRDGVSEGQYQQVLEQEVRDMRELFKEIAPKAEPKFTVVVAGKRHHIRFFPKGSDADRNGNPIPGTLVESGCTHPFEFDFYLCSHVAIKGTARPIHYQVILNEGNWSGEELQQFIFEHSFQYQRSTTPVSLFPAVYYAHLAADRARAHENVQPVSSGKKETKAEPKPKTETSSSDKPPVEVAPLIPMPPALGINETMWYI